MIKIGSLTLGRCPLIAAVITDIKNKTQIKESVQHGADLLEFRIDFFNDIKRLPETLKWLHKRFNCPIIGTVRSKVEGGKRLLTDIQRREIFNQIIPFVDAVDIELSSRRIIKDIVGSAREHNKKVIISYHNFKETPSDRKLNKIIKDSIKAGADIIKLSVMSRCYKDILRLAIITLRHKNIITMSMGEAGKISRVLFPVLGSLITYGEIGVSSAPGQMPLNILKRELELYTKRGGL